MNRSMPAGAWLVLAALSFAAALASWPGPRPVGGFPLQAQGLATPSDDMPAPPTAGDGAADAVAQPATPPRPVTAPVVLDDKDRSLAPWPQAGRQVLRCVEKGHTVYRDAGTACAEGSGEAVTLFPTRGVEAPR